MRRIKINPFRLVVFLFPAILILGGTFLAYKISEKQAIIKYRNSFTPLEITLPGNKTHTVTAGDKVSPLLLIYFDPDCYYCHIEAGVITGNIDELSNANIYMITTSPWEEIYEFIRQHRLQDYPDIRTGRVCRQSFYSSFGTRIVPTLFIYDREGILVYNNSGFTPISEILEVLKNQI